MADDVQGAAGRPGRGAGDHLFHDGPEVGGSGVECELPSLHLGEVEEPVGERQEPSTRRGDRGDLLPHVLREGAVQEELGHPQDPVQRGAELVAHDAHEFPADPQRFVGLAAGELRGGAGGIRLDTPYFGDLQAGLRPLSGVLGGSPGAVGLAAPLGQAQVLLGQPIHQRRRG